MENTTKEQRRQRLVEFFDSQHGYRRVAEASGISVQGLYYIVKGREVTLEIIDRLIEHYGHDFPADYVLWGVRPEEPQVISNDTPEKPEKPEDADMEKLKLQHKVELLTRENQMLKAENQKVWRLALPPQLQAELDFLRSGGHTTAPVAVEARQSVYGYVRYDQSEITDEAKVMPLNKTVGEALRILNSLNPEGAKKISA